MKDYINLAISMAKEAGDFLYNNFHTTKQIDKKADKSLVTNIDKRAEKLILDTIKGTFPMHSILAEESGEQKGNEFLWVIDPLDGTHNYIRGIGMYGVNIGLLRGDEFIVGVIYLPHSAELYYAEKGSGSFKNGIPLKVSACSSMEQCTLLYDSGFQESGKSKLGVLGEISRKLFNIRMLGASSRNLTYLAEGIGDALIEFDEKPWDFAAGIPILLEAGGSLKGHNGEDISIKSRKYIASNGILDLELRMMLQGALKSIEKEG